jgi:predicted choloylglycine hydrolase
MGQPTRPDVVMTDVAFRAFETGPGVSPALQTAFHAAWPSYRDWYLRDGEDPRPTYAECLRAMEYHVPELLPTYSALLTALDAGDLEARFLSHWCPPPLFAACSMVAWPTGPLLLRNYDYPPAMCETTLLASHWGGVRVLAMADCLWGALDGVNAHGLAVAIAFGGRPATGPGFGIGLIVRYLLQVCGDVPSALEVLARLPVSLCYNVALLDASGRAAIAYISPDRPLAVADGITAANRQGASEWPEYEKFCGTVERECLLADAVAERGVTAGSLVDRMITAPVHRSTAESTWGTVYTTVYDPVRLTVDLVWPGESWRHSMHDFVDGLRVRRTPVHLPPERQVETVHVPTHRPLLIA